MSLIQHHAPIPLSHPTTLPAGASWVRPSGRPVTFVKSRAAAAEELTLTDLAARIDAVAATVEPYGEALARVEAGLLALLADAAAVRARLGADQ